MIAKDADWEKRNLGVSAKIFYLDAKDTGEDICREIESCDAEYQQVLIPDGNTEALLAIQEIGFHVMEMQIHLRKDLREVSLPRVCQQFEPDISYSYANEQDIVAISDKIKSGDMFLTDKIAKDPMFGVEVAGRRYSLWFADLVRDGALVINANYKGETIGFGTFVDVGRGTYSGLLGGIFPEFSGEGLGFVPQYISLLALKERGAKKALGHVSSNNLPVLRCLELLGYSVFRLEYVLVKHLNQDF